jgi:hypothetical protein
MNKKLFNFQKDTGSVTGDLNDFGKVVGAFNVNKSKSDLLVPTETGKPIDVVKDFKWTKTSRNSEGRKNTPTVQLEEYSVVVPAFFSNLDVVLQVLTNTAEGGAAALNSVAEIAGFGESITSLVGDAVGAVKTNVNKLLDEGRRVFGAPDIGSMPTYLKAYENLYGVKRTKFKYNLPYLENDYKSIKNSWGTQDGQDLQSLLGQDTGSFIETDLFGKIGPGVGIDYSKSFTYGGDGPSHNISFFLDNTKDAEYGGFETNFRLIYLLLYQNLPNRINKITFVPPVIYRALLPGVFSYRWSYISNIEVKMIGVRRVKTVNDFIDGKPSQVVIPEGYEVNLTIQSLVPETQNLYYDAVSNNVVVTEE